MNFIDGEDICINGAAVSNGDEALRDDPGHLLGIIRESSFLE